MDTERDPEFEAAVLRVASDMVSAMLIGLTGCLIGVGIGVFVGWLVWA